MKYKNYYNYELGNRDIYSHNDILGMSVSDLIHNELPLSYQYLTIGIPKDEELTNSPNTHQYTDSSGKLRWRSSSKTTEDLIEEERRRRLEQQQQNAFLQNKLGSNNIRTAPRINNNPELTEFNISDSNDDSLLDNASSIALNGLAKIGIEKLKGFKNKNADSQSEQPQNQPSIENQESPYVLNGVIEKNTIKKPEIVDKLSGVKEKITGSLEGRIDNAKQKLNSAIDSKLDKIKQVPHKALEYFSNAIEHEVDKYKGLTPLEKVGKLASKMPINLMPQQYYGHAAHLADGEKPSLYMKYNNDICKYGEIKDANLKEILKKQAATMKGVDINDPNLYEKIKDVDVVIPKENSPLSKEIKKSNTFQQFIVDNYDDILNNKEINSSIAYPFGKNMNLWATIGKTNVTKLKDSNDIVNNDIYNFEHWDTQDLLPHKDNINMTELINYKDKIYNNLKAYVNNFGYEQQEKGKLRNYLLSPTISLNEKELHDIISSYKHKKLR